MKNYILKNRKFLIISLTTLLIIFFDQLTKSLIAKNFEMSQSLPILNNIFHLTFVKNTGAGFGILKGYNALLIIISLAVIGIIFYYYKQIRENGTLLQIIAAFVLGGTIGNLTDRITLGYVIDFLDFRIWPVFNIADSFVTIGIIGLVIYFWRD